MNTAPTSRDALPSPAPTAPTPRMSMAGFSRALPDAVPALRALSQSVAIAGLDKGLIELVKVRVSQLNGCAFCLRIHIDWALEAGVTRERLDLLAAWHDSALFDVRERAALAWAEALTRMALAPVSDADHAAVSAVFTPTELAGLSAAIAGINAWNRIAGALRFAPAGRS